MSEMPIYYNDADGTLWGSSRQTPSAVAPALSPSRPPALSSGSAAAGEVAARISGKRKQRILELLQQRGPLTLWELAEAMSVQVNQISGRITELKFDGQILETGLRKHPHSGILCAVYAICNSSVSSAPSAVKTSSLTERLRP